MSEHFFTAIENGCEKVPESGCWIWMKSVDKYGYGQIRRGSRPGKLYYTHRLVVQAPAGTVAMHICDVPACCNPAHIRIGTQADNMQDMIKKERHNTSQPRGENSKLTKFSDSVLHDILHCSGTRKTISHKYGCSPSLVAKVKRGVYRDQK